MRTLASRATLWLMAAAVWAHPPTEVYADFGMPLYPALAGLTALFSFAAALHRPERRWTAALGTAGALTWAATELISAAAEPMRGLFIALATVAIVALLWPPDRLRNDDLAQPEGARRGIVMLPLWLGAAFALHATIGRAALGLPTSAALSALHAVVPTLMLLERSGSRWERAFFGSALVAAALPLVDGSTAAIGHRLALAPGGLLAALLTSVALRPKAALPTPARFGSLADLLFARPSRVLVVSFLALCLLGTFVLRLPVSTTSAVSWLDAAFTATSAVCVTGLIVLDTPSAFTGFGQLTLLLLIQLGGLGIMAVSAAAVALLGRRLPVSYERTTAQLIGVEGRSSIQPTIRLILLTTFVTEGVCAALLFVGFVARGESAGPALWRAVFTAISAFCNAGFALQTDSLVPYADSPYILTVVGLTIVIGGLGPVVVAALTPWRPDARRTVQVRLIVWTSVLLLIVPAILIAIVEWNTSLAGLRPSDRVVNAAFQSVTLRTAGFNSIDLTQIRPTTWTLMVMTMFIGGSPGSTAGGIKTTTFAMVVLLVFAVVGRSERVTAFGRQISLSSVRRATATTAVAAFGVVATTLALLLTQDIRFDVVVFEAVSALATVGLSTGGTGGLDQVGKVLVIACMFSGRIGSLTLFLFLSRSVGARYETLLPEEAVATG